MAIYNSNTLFAKPGVTGNSRLFLSDTVVSPALAGKPTLLEIDAAAPTATNVIAYYTGTNISTDVPTFVYTFDSLGVVTLLEDPEEATTLLYKGKLSSVAAIKALTKASLIDSELRIVNNVPYMWNVAATVGAFQPIDTVSPGIDAGWWIKIADEYAGTYSSTEAYSIGDVVLHNNKLYKSNIAREDGVWGATPIASDSQFRPLGGIIQQFDTALSYAVGDLVYAGDTSLGVFPGVYKVLTAFVGGSFQIASEFELIFHETKFRGQFNAIAYAAEDIVEHQGQLYKAKFANGGNGVYDPFDPLEWDLLFSSADTVISYLDYSLFKADTSTIFKVGDKISIDNPFQLLQVTSVAGALAVTGVGFSNIATQPIINQAQGLEFSNGTQFASDFIPDSILYGNNYYVAFLTGTTNINVAALENDTNTAIASIGQVINFTVFNTTAVSTTIVFDASWKDSAGAALGIITLAAGEYRRITFEGYYAIPTELRLVEYASTGGSLIDWTTSTAYVVNDLVRTESRVYRAITAHTSGVFTTDRANWEVIVPLKQSGGWGAVLYYYEGDTIIEPYVGRTLLCATSHTANGGSFEPDRANWDVIVPIQAGLPWTVNTYYYQNDIVYYAPRALTLKKSLSGLSDFTFANTEAVNWDLISSDELNTWTAATYYYSGEEVEYANKILKQIVGQVSFATFSAFESVKWRVTQSRTEQWLPNTFYYANEQVTNNGLTYSKASAGVTGATFDVTEELNWLRVGGYSSNPKVITSATYTVLATDEILSFDATANNIVVTFPITLPEGKFFTIHYKKTANSVTFTAGAGTTIVSPLTYTEQASFDAQGSVGQIGTTKIFRLGTVFNFLG